MNNITISADEAQEICAKALARAGTKESTAETVAKALIRAEKDGQKGHGISRVLSYAAQVQTGKVKGQVHPVLEDVKPGLFRINAKFGFAYPAIQLALPELELRTKKNGIAAAAIYHSHHFGVAGHHCEDLAEKGLVAFIYGNSPKALAPPGAKEKVLGTNPIAFAAPTNDEPLVIDLALSTVARGKILSARQAGTSIPEGWALDRDGKPTTDPEKAIQGSMMPIGGAKGAALALLVEVMSACLAGAALGVEASNLFDADGSPPDLGQVILAIDPQALSNGSFKERMATLAEIYNRVEGARFPGTSRLKNRNKSASEGLTVSASLLQEIQRFGF